MREGVPQGHERLLGKVASFPLSAPDHRTLIARLGFADRDRRLPEHDLACHYLAPPR